MQLAFDGVSPPQNKPVNDRDVMPGVGDASVTGRRRQSKEAGSGRCCLDGKVRDNLGDEVTVGQLLKTRKGDTALGRSAPGRGTCNETAVT